MNLFYKNFDFINHEWSGKDFLSTTHVSSKRYNSKFKLNCESKNVQTDFCNISSTELTGKRTLFTQDSLGITAYIANRELEFTFTTHPEQFKDEFRQKVEHTVPLNLLVDNLKRYVHVFNPNLNEIELLWKALRLFKTQSDQWQRKSQIDKKKVYIFGPIVMRALSYHDIPEYAIKVR